MITEKDLKNAEITNVNFEELEAIIDESIKRYHGYYPWEEAIIKNEYSLEVRNIIAKKYQENGWNYVYHRTSSENGEIPGLTSFKFSKTKLDDKYVKRMHVVQGDIIDNSSQIIEDIKKILFDFRNFDSLIHFKTWVGDGHSIIVKGIDDQKYRITATKEAP